MSASLPPDAENKVYWILPPFMNELNGSLQFLVSSGFAILHDQIVNLHKTRNLSGWASRGRRKVFRSRWVAIHKKVTPGHDHDIRIKQFAQWIQRIWIQWIWIRYEFENLVNFVNWLKFMNFILFTTPLDYTQTYENQIKRNYDNRKNQTQQNKTTQNSEQFIVVQS